jgi:hypothetical protein
VKESPCQTKSSRNQQHKPAYDATALKALKDKDHRFRPCRRWSRKTITSLSNRIDLVERRHLGGALIGLIAGAPGAAIGAAIGAMSGLTGDAVTEALDSDFVDSVTKEMRPGMTAIIVEADEKSTRPVDDVVKLSGGHVYRQAA